MTNQANRRNIAITPVIPVTWATASLASSLGDLEPLPPPGLVSNVTYVRNVPACRLLSFCASNHEFSFVNKSQDNSPVPQSRQAPSRAGPLYPHEHSM